jgi:hypothetical protein
MDLTDTVRGAARDLSREIDGIEPGTESNIHLRISDPVLAAWLRPLGKDINDFPKPPRIFRPKVEQHGENAFARVPWLSPTGYVNEHVAEREQPIVLSFVPYSSNAQDSDQRRRQNRKYAQRRSDELVDAGIPPERQIVAVSDGRVSEEVTHRLATYFLTTRGWFVASENHFPTGQIIPGGTPDIVAWKSPLTETIRQAELVDGGATVEELAYLSSQDVFANATVPEELADAPRESLVAEVKGSKRSIGEYTNQLKKYMRSNYFDVGYGIVPGYRDREPPYRGMITLDQQGFQLLPDPDTGQGWVTEEEKAWFVQRMDRIACQAMLCNLDFETLTNVVAQAENESIETPHDIVQRAWTLSPQRVVEKVVTDLSDETF